MLKKKPTKKAEKQDFTVLDAAVSELSKQTEALLGKTGEKASKPNLPKKKSIPHTKGKSFDIIHNPKQKAALKASLKTAVVSQHKSTPLTEQSTVLLPDHATKSFNETSSIEESPKTVAEEVPAAPVIRGHDKKLALSVEKDVSDSSKEVATEPESTESVPEPSVSHSAISFMEEKESTESEKTTSEASAAPAESPDPEAGPEEVSAEPGPKEPVEPDSKPAEDETPAEPPAYNSGELFANNLVKESKPHGYKPDENQQKPTVFDTNEYHPELHDWSKLEHSGGLRWLTLLLLLVVAGALGYFVVSGQTLPF